MNGVWLLGLVSISFAGLGMLLLNRGRKQSQAEQILHRLGHSATPPEPQDNRFWETLNRAFLRAGVELPQERLRLLLKLWLGCMLVALLAAGWQGVLATLLLPPLLLRPVLSWRYHKRMRRMVGQLVPLLDQVIRSLQTGRTLGDAVIAAIGQAPEPLHTALSQVARNVDRRVPLADALRDAAELYDQEELRIFALGAQVNERYGGSSIELLQGLIQVINEREQAARQLRAMTGETRITAVVLAVLPVAVAGYILVINPQYILSMWGDASGQRMLLVSLSMQILGCFLLWRMLRSVG